MCDVFIWALNNHDLITGQNNHDYDFCHNQAPIGWHLFSMIILRFSATWHDYLAGDFLHHNTWLLSETYFLERKECSFLEIWHFWSVVHIWYTCYAYIYCMWSAKSRGFCSRLSAMDQTILRFSAMRWYRTPALLLLSGVLGNPLMRPRERSDPQQPCGERRRRGNEKEEEGTVGDKLAGRQE